jgi:hypothetical protein
MSLGTLTSVPTNSESLEISPEAGKAVLDSFRSLFTNTDLVNNIQDRINTMDNGIHKQLMEAALRRVLHLTSSAEQVKESAHQKLQNLMANIQDSMQPKAQA